MKQYDPSYLPIFEQDHDRFLVGLTLPCFNVRPPRPEGDGGLAAVIVNLKSREVSGIGFAPSMLKLFQFALPISATPEEQEEVRRLAWPTQEVIFNDPDVRVSVLDLTSTPRPLDEWRYSNPNNPAKLRFKERARLARLGQEPEQLPQNSGTDLANPSAGSV